MQSFLCFIMVWYRSIWPISFRVTSLVLGQLYDCPSASEVTLKDMGKPITWISGKWSCNHTKIKKNKAQPCSAYFMTYNVFVIWYEAVINVNINPSCAETDKLVENLVSSVDADALARIARSFATMNPSLQLGRFSNTCSISVLRNY